MWDKILLKVALGDRDTRFVDANQESIINIKSTNHNTPIVVLCIIVGLPEKGLKPNRLRQVD